MKTAMRMSTLVASMIVLTGCANFSTERKHPDEASVVTGPSVTDNTTPMQEAFQCMGQRVKQTSQQPPVKMTVGNVKDYTGKFSEIKEGGNAITQGGSLMVISALGKLGGAVRLFERFDTQIAKMELGFMDQRRLTDGQVHTVNGEGGQQQQVPWKPYYGGSIMETDYFIVGGITELNYNISSGGAEARVNGIGPKARTFTVSVAADLRVVDTQSLKVMHTTSLQKQVVGYEVGFEIFKFFDDELFDLNAGLKKQEPLQLAVRTTLELGVLELVGAVTDVDHSACVNFEEEDLPPTDIKEDTDAGEVAQYEVHFKNDSAELTRQAEGVVDDAARAALAGDDPSLLLEGHTDTSGSRTYNLELSRQRAESVQRALIERGVPRERISLAWYGESSPATQNSDGTSNEENRRVVIHIKHEAEPNTAPLPQGETEGTGPTEAETAESITLDRSTGQAQEPRPGQEGYRSDAQRHADPGMND